MSKPRSPWLPLIIALAAAPITICIVFWITFYVTARLSEGWCPAWFGNSSYAEIMVFTPDDSPDGYSVEFVPFSATKKYVAEHPGSTFLVPSEKQEQVKDRLATSLHLSWQTFEIKALADGEEITLFFMDRTDDSHGSRYKAAKDSVQLESYRYISDRGGIGVLLLAVLLTSAVHILVFGSLLIRGLALARRIQQKNPLPVEQ